MNFAEFLLKRKRKYNIPTTKDHYESLGGQMGLSMTLRHFREIESGNHKPPEKLFEVLFKKVSETEKKDLVIAFFNSILSSKTSKLVSEFIEVSMMSAPPVAENIWNSSILSAFYTSEQLDYLIKNEDALLFHKKVLLYEKVSEKSVTLSRSKINRLIDLDLISLSRGYYTTFRQIYMLPRFEDSNPKEVMKATQYIMKNKEIFLQGQGSQDQDLSYVFQLVDKDIIPVIVEQIKGFKKWIKSFAQPIPTPNSKPFMFISFSRALSEKELESKISENAKQTTL